MSDLDDNPFRAPQSDLGGERVAGVLSGTKEDLRSVARYQRTIMLCILGYLCAIPLQFILPRELVLIVALVVLGAAVTGTVFVFLLSAKVYGTVQGIFFALFTLVPCLGLLVLLLINSKATNVLKANGIKVGLLGANPADIQ